MKASEFKARCLAVMDEVTATGDSVIVTQKGRPVAELKRYQAQRRKNLFGIWEGQIDITGGIISPLDVEWDAMKRSFWTLTRSSGRHAIPASSALLRAG